MLTDAKIEYYSFIGPSAGKEHDRDSIFLHIIVFGSLDNGTFPCERDKMHSKDVTVSIIDWYLSPLSPLKYYFL